MAAVNDYLLPVRGDADWVRETEHQGRPRGTMKQALTMVAEMPGYPMRKLPFAGPETRTKAAISIELFPQHHGHAAEGAQ